jgi:hypothetical protein
MRSALFETLKSPALAVVRGESCEFPPFAGACMLVFPLLRVSKSPDIAGIQKRRRGRRWRKKREKQWSGGDGRERDGVCLPRWPGNLGHSGILYAVSHGVLLLL